MRTLIVCVGNSLVADDGVGSAVFAALTDGRARAAEVRLEHVGLSGIALLDLLDGEDLLVVVDAVRLGARPGTVHVLPWDTIPSLNGQPVTSHGIGLREVIVLARQLYPEKAPSEVVLVGIEGQRFDQLVEGLTPAVAAAVEHAAETVMELATSHTLDRSADRPPGDALLMETP